ncbi:FHA domain-containing protein [Streptomyces sp. LX-29]|uniref:FHA domain-containing protein n=1 Tax=Streptomyces sp. LX-29 TaxID=2900152 RepID=UPI00240E4521|nr:FHA domain-containing protein [Streptomyces sp. LX-29]WFB09189.1 FHA domain-containing protein [Streptomyces sp. LX-29]
MRIRLTVLGPRPGQTAPAPAPTCAVDVLVTAPAGTPLASVASGLATAVAAAGADVGSGTPVLYAGAERLDAQRRVLGEPPLVDGAILSVNAPADTPHHAPDEPSADAALRLHVVAGPDAGGVHLLHGGQVRVGRSADADVPLDDPDVSRLHCAVSVTDDGRVTIADLNSTNGTSLDGRPVGPGPVPLAPDALLRIGESALRLRLPSADAPDASATPAAPVPDGEGRLRVSPRGDASAAAGPSAALAAPPGAPGAPGGQGAVPYVPHGGPYPVDAHRTPPRGLPTPDGSGHADHWDSGLIADQEAAERGMSGYGDASAGRWERVDHGRGAPLPTPRRRGISAWARRLTGGRAGAEHPASGPRDETTEAEREAARARAAAEAAALHRRWPDASDILMTALGPGPRLWERGPDHPDALTVRLGTADRPATGGGTLPGVPVTVDLRRSGALGLAGPRARLAGLARSVIAQLAALHAPGALHLVLISTDRTRPGEDRLAEWSWLGWLPQLRPAQGQDCRLLLAYDREQAAARTAELVRRLDDSRLGPGWVTAPAAAVATAAAEYSGPYTVVIVDGDPDSPELREDLARLAAGGPAAGVHLICLAETLAPLAAPASSAAGSAAAAHAAGYADACAASPVFAACDLVALITGDVATSVHVVRPRRPERAVPHPPPGTPGGTGAPSGPTAHGTGALHPRSGTPGPRGGPGAAGAYDQPGPADATGRHGAYNPRGTHDLPDPQRAADAQGQPGAYERPGAAGAHGQNDQTGAHDRSGTTGGAYDHRGTAAAQGRPGAAAPYEPDGSRQSGPAGADEPQGPPGTGYRHGATGAHGRPNAYERPGTVGAHPQPGAPGQPGTYERPGAAGAHGQNDQTGAHDRSGTTGGAYDHRGTAAAQGRPGAAAPYEPDGPGQPGRSGADEPQGPPGTGYRHGATGAHGQDDRISPHDRFGTTGTAGGPGRPEPTGAQGRPGEAGAPERPNASGQPGRTGGHEPQGTPGAGHRPGTVGAHSTPGAHGTPGTAGTRHRTGAAGPSEQPGMAGGAPVPRGAYEQPGGTGAHDVPGRQAAFDRSGATGPAAGYGHDRSGPDAQRAAPPHAGGSTYAAGAGSAFTGGPGSAFGNATGSTLTGGAGSTFTGATGSTLGNATSSAFASATGSPFAGAAGASFLDVGEEATVDAVSAAWAERFARALAPLRPAGAGGRGEAGAGWSEEQAAAALPSSARLLDELGLARATPASLLARWAAAADEVPVGGRAVAVVGAGPDGPLSVDLAADGPHLLVNGAAGTGKTELLRSLAASLAAAERPDRLGLVLVDGGGAERGEGLRMCLDLPHVSTYLAASDPVRMREFAQALGTELKRRAELLGPLDFLAWNERQAGGERVVAQRQPADADRAAAAAPAPTTAPTTAPAPASAPAGAPDRVPAQATARDASGGGHGRGAADLTSTGSVRTLQLRMPAPVAGLARLVVLVDDYDALVAPALGSPGRPAAGSVVRALEAVARDGARLGVHLIAASGRPDRTAETAAVERAGLWIGLESPAGAETADGTAEAAAPAGGEAAPAPSPGRGRLSRPDDDVATPFQAGRVTGRIPRTATQRPTVVPLDWERMGDPPTRRPLRELGNGPTDLALLASALQRAAQSAEAPPVPPLT